MKKNIIAFVFILASIGAYAQTDKGSFMVGGSLRWQRSHSDVNLPAFGFEGTTTGSFNINPTVGYFVMNRLMLGLQPSYSHTWVFHQPMSKITSFSIGPVVRYYIPFGKFAAFPEASYSYLKSKQQGFDTVSGRVVDVNKNGSTYHVAAGVTYFVSPSIGIEGIIGYTDNKNMSYSVKKLTDLYLNFGIQFYLAKRS